MIRIRREGRHCRALDRGAYTVRVRRWNRHPVASVAITETATGRVWARRDTSVVAALTGIFMRHPALGCAVTLEDLAELGMAFLALEPQDRAGLEPEDAPTPGLLEVVAGTDGGATRLPTSTRRPTSNVTNLEDYR